MPDVGRFFNIDPLAAKYPYNSTYAIQENKMGMGVELEGLELLPCNTGFFAIRGNEVKVKRAPVSQTYIGGDGLRHASFTAGGIGLTPSGYNPNALSFSQGGKGFQTSMYKYNGPLPSGAEMQDTTDKISNKDRQSFTTTKRGAEMWNLKQVKFDKGITAWDGINEVKNLFNLIINLPNLFESNSNYVQAVNDVETVKSQAITMNRAINLVDSSGIEMDSTLRGYLINYVFDGTLPNPNGGIMPNSNVIINGDSILRSNNLPIPPLPLPPPPPPPAPQNTNNTILL